MAREVLSSATVHINPKLIQCPKCVGAGRVHRPAFIADEERCSLCDGAGFGWDYEFEESLAKLRRDYAERDAA